MVHIRPADRAGKMCLELFDCEMDTSIRELKQKVRLFQNCLSTISSGYSL